MKKALFLLFLLLLTPNVFAQQKSAQSADMESYIKRLMELTSEGENNSWLILDALAAHMSEESAVFKIILKEAEKNDDRSAYLIGKYYLAKGKYEQALKWLGKITNERYRNARFMLAVALMHKAAGTGNEAYYEGAAAILNELRNVKAEALANAESINFLLKACESGTAERKIFTDSR